MLMFLLSTLLLAADFGLGYWFGRKSWVKPPIPQPVIVTVHDSFPVPGPLEIRWKWKVDTLPVPVAPIVIRETKYDTFPRAVADTSKPEWMVERLEIGRRRGDTSLVQTRSGDRAILSRLWTPGPLHTLVADSIGVPRMTWWPSVEPKQGSGSLGKWLNRGLGVAMGIASCRYLKLGICK